MVVKTKSTNPRKYITEQELETLIKGRVKGKRESKKRVARYQAMLSLLFYHGLRRQELCNLKWSHIDFAAGVIHVPRLKGGVNSVHPLVSKEKALLEYLKSESKGEYVIESPQGDQMSVDGIASFFRRVNKQKLLPLKLHPHMLRHGCGFHLANKGIDTRSIQVYLGHSSIRSTEIYTEINAARFSGFFD